MTWPAGQSLEAVLARAEHVRRETDRGAVPVRDLNLFVERDDMLLYFLRNDFPVLLEYVAKLEGLHEQAKHVEYITEEGTAMGKALEDLKAFRESAERLHGRPVGIQLGRT
jgi:hypothetical protein